MAIGADLHGEERGRSERGSGGVGPSLNRSCTAVAQRAAARAFLPSLLGQVMHATASPSPSARAAECTQRKRERGAGARLTVERRGPRGAEPDANRALGFFAFIALLSPGFLFIPAAREERGVSKLSCEKGRHGRANPHNRDARRAHRCCANARVGIEAI